MVHISKALYVYFGIFILFECLDKGRKSCYTTFKRNNFVINS